MLKFRSVSPLAGRTCRFLRRSLPVAEFPPSRWGQAKPSLSRVLPAQDRPTIRALVEDERLLGVIRLAHGANYEAYGSRRMCKALRREGEDIGRGHVQRLMSANGLCGAKRRGKPWRTTIQGADPVASPDLLNRDFTAAAANLAWVADFTYIRCWEGVVFFSFVLDVYSRYVVGWQFARHMRTELVQDALDMAVAARDVVLVHHSDRGSQPRSTGPRNSAW